MFKKNALGLSWICMTIVVVTLYFGSLLSYYYHLDMIFNLFLVLFFCLELAFVIFTLYYLCHLKASSIELKIIKFIGVISISILVIVNYNHIILNERGGNYVGYHEIYKYYNNQNQPMAYIYIEEIDRYESFLLENEQAMKVDMNGKKAFYVDYKYIIINDTVHLSFDYIDFDDFIDVKKIGDNLFFILSYCSSLS